jgi:peptidoglycan/LPS O-acetylase OafA/YrhL
MFRIFPAYLFVLGTVIGLGLAGFEPWAGVLAADGPAGAISNALLVQEYVGHAPLIGVSWTLSLEFAWYGFFVAALLLCGEGRVFRLALLGSAGLVALSAISVLADLRLPLGRLGMLNAAFLGYVGCLVHRGLLPPSRFRVALAAFILSVIVSQYVGFGYVSHPRVAFSGSLVAWVAAIALFASFHQSRVLRESALATNPVATRLGEISYSVYLVHAPVISVWFAVFGTATLLPAATVLTIVLAQALYSTIEVPGMALGRRVADRIGQAGAAGMETR